MSAAAIIVNWNGLAETRRCLESLAPENVTTFVVDNASRDGSVTALRREFSSTRVVEAPENLGYAGGVNLGLRTALRENHTELLILNNDTRVEPGMTSALRGAAADPAIGLAGPLVLRDDGSFWYAGGSISRRPFRVREITDPARAHSEEGALVDYVPGCAIWIRRDALERIGLLDERFFLMWEDTDWSMRAAKLGYRNVVVPGARVRHLGSRAFEGQFSALYCYYFLRNMLLFARTHFPRRDRPSAYRNAVGYARGVTRRTPAPSRRRVGFAFGLALAHFSIGRYGPAPACLGPR